MPSHPLISQGRQLEFLNVIEEQLRILSQQSTSENQLYFTSEFDSSQTIFERRSNHLEIAVEANNKKVGRVLVHLLRIIIDEYPDLLLDMFEDDEYLEDLEREITFEDLIETLSRRESEVICYRSDEPLTTTLYGSDGYGDIKKITIKKDRCDVEVWNMERIMTTVKRLF